MKVIIFGLGKYYQNRKEAIEEILKNDEIIAFSDNNPANTDNADFQPFFSPETISELLFDVILITSIHYKQIRDQLVSFGVSQERILRWEEFYYNRKKSEIIKYNSTNSLNKKKCLIISNNLRFDGAPIALFGMMDVLQNNGYDIVVSGSSGDKEYIDEMKKRNVEVWICPTLLYCVDSDYNLSDFDIVIVNTVVMAMAAYRISKYKKVIWWIHEGEDRYTHAYSYTWDLYPECFEEDWLERVSVYSVSNKGRRNFLEFFPNAEVKLCPLGIPDEKEEMVEDGIITIAIIGYLSQLKGQKVLAEAVGMMPAEKKSKLRVWMIGSDDVDEEYTQIVKNTIKKDDCFTLLGQKNRAEIRELYKSIDIVVCASQAECLPLSIIEAMMHGKVCVTTNNTGIAEYIEDGKNGFIVKAGDPDELKKCLMYIVDNPDVWKKVAMEARRTYEEYFSMGVFARNVERVIGITRG